MKNSPVIKKAECLHGGQKLFRLRLNELEKRHGQFSRRLNKARRILTQKRRPYFNYLTEDGVLDSSRFTRVAVDPTVYDYYKQEVDGDITPACITFLIDPATTAETRQLEDIACAVDMLSCGLDAADINSAVYSYDADSLVAYKNDQQKWVRCKDVLALMLIPAERGEARSLETVLPPLVRIIRRQFEPRRAILFISDTEIPETVRNLCLKSRISVLQVKPGSDSGQGPGPEMLEKILGFLKLRLKPQQSG